MPVGYRFAGLTLASENSKFEGIAVGGPGLSLVESQMIHQVPSKR
jgi:hypothetical protein